MAAAVFFDVIIQLDGGRFVQAPTQVGALQVGVAIAGGAVQQQRVVTEVVQFLA